MKGFPNLRWMQWLGKTRLFCLGLAGLLAVLLSFGADAPKAVEEDSDFVEARRLFWSGQYDEAEKLFKAYLMAHPKHEPTQNFLLMIAQARIHDEDKIGQTRKRLKEIEVEQVDFKETEWRDVVTRLQELANPKEDGKDPKNYINFINLLPTQFSVKITLNLRKVNLLRVIEFACKQAGLRFVVDTWAVIIELPEPKK